MPHLQNANMKSPSAFASGTLLPLHRWPIEAVLAVQAHAYGPDLLESAEVLASKMAAGRAFCLGAGHDAAYGAKNGSESALRGYAIALPWHSACAPQWNHAAAPADVPDCVYLHDLAIAPECRGQGLAVSLLRGVLQSARALGLRRAVLVAVQGADVYWQRHGFAQAVPPQSLRSFGEGAVWMTRSLNEL